MIKFLKWIAYIDIIISQEDMILFRIFEEKNQKLLNKATRKVWHRWELPILHYHRIIEIYPYPFLMVITLFLSWIIFVNNCICILNGLPR